MDMLQTLLFPTQFIPHGHCYLWQPQLVWLHLLSDILIAIAYYSIPVMLVYFVRKRQDVPFPGIFLLFGLFITTCGTTHLMSVWTLWHPSYWLSGAIKALTALVSIYTALMLFPTIPAALALPKPDELVRINQQLKTQIEERKQAEAALQYQLEFDQLVSEISTRFINLSPDNIEEEISQALQAIGQFIQVDTSYIFELDPQEKTLRMSYEWVDEAHRSKINQAQNIPQAAFPWALDILKQGQVLNVPSVDNLPTAAKIEQNSWQVYHLKSLICVPLSAQGILLGWVGFASFQQEQSWPESSYQLLRMVAEILTRALQRQQAEISLRQSEARLQMALEAGQTTCWEHHLTTGTVQGFGRLAGNSWSPETWQHHPKRVLKEVHPQERLQVNRTILNAIQTRSEFAIEHRLSNPSQDATHRPEAVWVLTKGKILLNASGQPERIAGLTIDITDRKRTELSLKESEERWQLAMRGTNDGIWDWNVETNEVFYSARFKQMLGYEDYEFTNRTEEWSKRVHPDDIDHVYAAVQEHFNQNTAYYMTEHRMKCKDGTYKWILDRAKALRDETGKVIRMTGSHTDITARKQAEAQLQQLNRELETRVEERTMALKKSEKRFRSLFESAPDFIYVLDQKGIIQQVNSTVVKQSNYTVAELINQPLISFLSPQTQTDYQREFSTLLTQGHHHQELEFVCKGGQVLTMDCSYTVITNPDAEDYILVLQRDITERKHIEQERAELFATLQESERRWRSFLENARLIVVGLDQAGQVEYVNPHFSEIIGYPAEQVLGKNWFSEFAPIYQQQQKQDFFQTISNEESHHYQSRLVTQSGEERIINWNSTLLQDSKGQPIGTLSMGEDITERYAINRMKDEFISVVSHELRTPLTSIHGALDLLGSNLVDPHSGRGKHVLDIAVENSKRLVQLVNDILELERLESGKVKLHPSLVSTRDLVEQTQELMELMAERAEIQLEITKNNVLIWADRDRLIQVLTNLIDNAVKFSQPSSTIWVSVEHKVIAETAQVMFTVKDEGSGIPNEKLGGIFERFHQVDASDSRQKGGTGLGLAICRSIVQQHGGHIWVESTLGQGSCFFFTVPKGRVPES